MHGIKCDDLNSNGFGRKRWFQIWNDEAARQGEDKSDVDYKYNGGIRRKSLHVAV
ncbi:hypothetical protein GCM10011309_19200 [Litorimonas cladophorae]|uniref:Uncharacterized protein n=1 Tax=Litorimonas cladophorae TaxID=1220491 RepID=A0A918KP29_9PROT|nr:hypothetical protein GCM10011309_19200 [Litorimonas cladophorae]